MYTLDQVQAYLDANPTVRDQTAAWLQQGGDSRSVYQWVMDDLNQNPSSSHLAGIQQYLATSGGSATGTSEPTAAWLATQPDLQAAYTAAQQTTPNLSIGDFMLQWANSNPNDLRLSDSTFLASAGISTDSGTAGTPLEQALLNSALPGMSANVAQDAQRQQLATQLAQQSGTDYQSALDIINQATSGQKLAGEQTMADTTGASVAQAATDSANSQTSALQAQIQQLLAANVPVSDARIKAAQDQITSINLGLQQTLDQINASAATAGYVGGSTAQDAALARAAITAQQGAASQMGSANLANAMDTQSVNQYGANQGASIADTLAQQIQQAQNATAQQKLGNYNADWQTRLGAAAQLPALTNQYTTTLAGLSDYGNTGLKQTQALLNWWNTNQSTPSTPATFTVQPSTSGQDLSALGSGLLGSAINVGNANKWWQTPTTTPTTPAASTTYSPTIDYTDQWGYG